MANEITIDEAQKNLEEFINGFNTNTRSVGKRRQVGISSRYSTKSLSTRAENENSPFVYIFNLGNKEGYAIVASDRRVTPVLAFTTEGELTKDSVIDNPGMIMFLSRAEDYINSVMARPLSVGIPNHNLDDGKDTFTPWETIVFDNSNMACKVKWNQGNPYNKYCPLIKNEKDEIVHAVTGCVATATAQLMSIYQYPNQYKGYQFDWEEMNKIRIALPYFWMVDSIPTNQIARLMVLLGDDNNLNMRYGVQSYAQMTSIPRTLLNFGYTSGGVCKDYNTPTVVDELKNGYPVIAGGVDIIDEDKFLGITVKRTGTGHTWLINGLIERNRKHQYHDHYGNVDQEEIETKYYVLCNFGASGEHDGYYLSECFNLNRNPEISEGTRAISGNFEYGDIKGEETNYQYHLQTITGIRK